jgi:hypothetical protein
MDAPAGLSIVIHSRDQESEQLRQGALQVIAERLDREQLQIAQEEGREKQRRSQAEREKARILRRRRLMICGPVVVAMIAVLSSLEIRAYHIPATAAVGNFSQITWEQWGIWWDSNGYNRQPIVVTRFLESEATDAACRHFVNRQLTQKRRYCIGDGSVEEVPSEEQSVILLNIANRAILLLVAVIIIAALILQKVCADYSDS